MNRGRAISLLKTANDGGVIRRAGKALGRGVKATVKGFAHGGEGIAEGLGVHPLLGTIAGVGTLAAGTGLAARDAKNRIDNWRIQHGLYPGVVY